MKIKQLLTISLLATQPLIAELTVKDKPDIKDKHPIVKKAAPNDDALEQEKVQIAILLDTSSSMSGLIDQTRTQLWKVVNTFIDAERDGKTPFVEVALYEYGNSSLHMGNNYIRQIQPFTRDLDQLSKDLFALNTNGGEEYCGAVIQRALGDLKWDKSDKTYKAIFVAGNEAFTQGPVDARQACKDAVGKSIIVNTVHCGARDQGISGYWHDGAALAEGKFMIIDQDRAVAHISAPQDQAINDLGIKLNDTYIGYGSKREESVNKQKEADSFAKKNAGKGAQLSRSVAKASKNYSNRAWDIVDAEKAKEVNVEEMAVADLPEEMKEMKPAARRDYVDKMARKRATIQKQILDLNKQRETFIAKERKKQAEGGAKTLDQVLIETTRSQAKDLGYTFH